MKSFLMLSILSLIFVSSAEARFVVGNGGDAIQCQPSNDNKLNGAYSLDYIVTLANAQGDDGLTPVSSWKDSAERIYNLLLVKTPTLAPYFREFRETVFNKDYTKTKIWEPTPFGLVEIDDQNITSLIPANCHKDGKVQITQAVIRQFSEFSGTDKGHIIYKYDPAIVASLDQKSPLQLSMLMVHEWLWDLSQNVDRNRRINRFLHSREIETMAPEAVIDSLKGMGLSIPGVQSDIFDERICQGEPMKAKDFNEYYPGGFVLANWGALQIEKRERQLNCPAFMKACNLTWRTPSFPSDIFTQFRFSLSPNWTDGNRDYPLKILSPEYFTKNGGFFLPGRGQISCRFVEDPQFNIECKLDDPTLYYPLFSEATGIESKKWMSATLKATLTTECFRMRAVGMRDDDIYTTGGESGPLQNEIETVFYLRANNGVFLKPR